jgi:hypothetical protein
MSPAPSFGSLTLVMIAAASPMGFASPANEPGPRPGCVRCSVRGRVARRDACIHREASTQRPEHYRGHRLPPIDRTTDAVPTGAAAANSGGLGALKAFKHRQLP